MVKRGQSHGTPPSPLCVSRIAPGNLAVSLIREGSIGTWEKSWIRSVHAYPIMCSAAGCVTWWSDADQRSQSLAKKSFVQAPAKGSLEVQVAWQGKRCLRPAPWHVTNWWWQTGCALFVAVRNFCAADIDGRDAGCKAGHPPRAKHESSTGILPWLCLFMQDHHKKGKGAA